MYWVWSVQLFHQQSGRWSIFCPPESSTGDYRIVEGCSEDGIRWGLAKRLKHFCLFSWRNILQGNLNYMEWYVIVLPYSHFKNHHSISSSPRPLVSGNFTSFFKNQGIWTSKWAECSQGGTSRDWVKHGQPYNMTTLGEMKEWIEGTQSYGILLMV